MTSMREGSQVPAGGARRGRRLRPANYGLGTQPDASPAPPRVLLLFLTLQHGQESDDFAGLQHAAHAQPHGKERATQRAGHCRERLAALLACHSLADEGQRRSAGAGGCQEREAKGPGRTQRGQRRDARRQAKQGCRAGGPGSGGAGGHEGQRAGQAAGRQASVPAHAVARGAAAAHCRAHSHEQPANCSSRKRVLHGQDLERRRQRQLEHHPAGEEAKDKGGPPRLARERSRDTAAAQHLQAPAGAATVGVW